MGMLMYGRFFGYTFIYYIKRSCPAGLLSQGKAGEAGRVPDLLQYCSVHGVSVGGSRNGCYIVSLFCPFKIKC